MTTKTTNTENAISAATTKTTVARNKQPQTIKNYIKAYESEIARALPSMITAERFTRIAMTAITQNPMLAECTPQSFIGSMLYSAQLGLEPNTPLGQAYLIPYRNNARGIVECTFQVGYKGLIDLVRRSGEIQSIEAHIVYENDEFEYELGLEPKLKHKPAMSNRGEMIWVYAMYRLTNGGYAFEVMSKEDIQAHRVKYSKAKNSPWNTEFEEMAKKTVLKKVLKYAPLKTEYVQANFNDGNKFEFEQSGEIKVINDVEDTEIIEEMENGEKEN